MNCEEFERKLMQDPQNEDDAFHQHRLSCAQCQQQYDRMMKIEEKLFDAFELKADQQFVKDLEQKVAANAYFLKRRKRRFYAISASVLLAVLIGLTSFHFYANRSLTEFVLAHIDHETAQINASSAVNQAYFDHLLDKFDAHFLRIFKPVSYAEKCWLRTGYGLHLVFNGRNGPVTLLWMPGENISQQLIVKSDILQGKVYADRLGSFALVGTQGEPIEMLAESLRMAIRL